MKTHENIRVTEMDQKQPGASKHRDDIIEQPVKRFKFTKESAIVDIASSIDEIANSLQSMSKTYNDILRINANVVEYLRNVEKRKKAVSQTTEDTEISSKEKL